MNCNCNNISEGNPGTILRHVFGNVMRLAIPLTLRTIEGRNGEITSTDADFIPSSDYPVIVEFSKPNSVTKINVDAEMRDGNVAYIEDKGSIPVGKYAITVSCKDNNGNPYRFKQDAVLNVVDLTREAGITPPAEYEARIQYLDSAIYLALKGEDGVGIADISTESSSEVGGMNTVTFILTDGREKSFTILNGSGAVDKELNINSQSPISNKAVTEKFNQVDESLQNVFGDVDYDSSSKTIRFFAKDKPKTSENILISLDARPFIKDGMVNSVYISNNTLVITFNTDSGKEPIGVPLTSVFNPNNYYNKGQVDARILASQPNMDTLMLKADYIYPTTQRQAFTGLVKYNKLAHTVLDFIEGIGGTHEVRYGMIYGMSNGSIGTLNIGGAVIDLGPSSGHALLNKSDNKWYRYENGEWLPVGGSSGIRAAYDSENERIVFPAGSAVVVNERLIITT